VGEGTAAAKALEDTSHIPQGADCACATLEQLFPQEKAQGHTAVILLLLLAAVFWLGAASVCVRCGHSWLWLAS
jgi:hypothetical protein